MSQKNRFRFKALLVGFILAKIGISVFYLADVDHLTDLLIPNQTAVAQDKEPKDESPDDSDADISKTSSGETASPEKIEQLAEIQAIMGQLEDKRNRLKEKEAQIKKERSQLESLKRDIEEKIEQLAAVQKKIDEGLAKKEQMTKQAQQQKDVVEEAKIKHLVKMYTSMNPKKAAEIIDKMDMRVVHQVFSNMKGDQVGKILSFVDRDRAAKITEGLAPKIDK
jgi:flagellar motility protein MotE (MotC chaperone)